MLKKRKANRHPQRTKHEAETGAARQDEQKGCAERRRRARKRCTGGKGGKINGWRRLWHGIETLAATMSWEPQPARLAAGPQPGPTATTSVTLELCSVSGMFV